MNCVVIFGAVFVHLFSPLAVGARTWHITPDGSGDAPTIQAAIDLAEAGDEVLLAAGTYTWTSQGASGQSMIRMKRGVYLRGEMGAASTVVDASGGTGRVIRCVDVGAVRIEGLTITGGFPMQGPPDQFPDFPPSGGGIFSAGDSSPLISHCIVRNNRTLESVSGAGIYASGGTIVDCEILDNETGFDGSGAGIIISDGLISNCIVRGNRAFGDAAVCGGGVVLFASEIRDSSIEDNRVAGAFGADGGGITASGLFSRITRCMLVNNEASVVVHGVGRGGGVDARGVDCRITDCVFLANKVTGRGESGGGGAVRVDSGSFTMVRCTLVGNIESGGSFATGGVVFDTPGGQVESSIVAFNEGYGCFGPGVFSCSDVFGNSSGDTICGTDLGGNFGLDPEFCAQDPAVSRSVILQGDSPCLPGQHPQGVVCDLIGAGVVGCGSVAVEQRSWGEVKGRYRR